MLLLSEALLSKAGWLSAETLNLAERRTEASLKAPLMNSLPDTRRGMPPLADAGRGLLPGLPEESDTAHVSNHHGTRQHERCICILSATNQGERLATQL